MPIWAEFETHGAISYIWVKLSVVLVNVKCKVNPESEREAREKNFSLCSFIFTHKPWKEESHTEIWGIRFWK